MLSPQAMNVVRRRSPDLSFGAGLLAETSDRRSPLFEERLTKRIAMAKSGLIKANRPDSSSGLSGKSQCDQTT